MAGDVPEGRVSGRPIAEAFDLVLREYPGYTDQTLLDGVTFDRFKQMVEVIVERKTKESRDQQRWDLQIAHIQVVAIGSLLPGLARSKKQASALGKAAQSLKISDLLDTEEEQQKKKEDRVPTDNQVMRAFGMTGTGLGGVRV